MNPYSVIVKPSLSEKSDEAREAKGQYTFQIMRDATKADVKAAVEKLFGVTVRSVNTCITRGKTRRRGAHLSLGQKRKKAFVTLVEGQKLDIFDS